MAKQSAGIVLYRNGKHGIEVLLVHPGGPYWAKKDSGAWSIPKGEFTEEEEALAAARREFSEELGQPVPDGELLPLGTVKQPGGKIIHVWALSGDMDCAQVSSNTFLMEWPPKSGMQQAFPEVDRAAWFAMDKAALKLNRGQVPFIQSLAKLLGGADGPDKEP